MKDRDYIGEVLRTDVGLKDILASVPPEAQTDVATFLEYITKSSYTWDNLSTWRGKVRAEAYRVAMLAGDGFF